MTQNESDFRVGRKSFSLYDLPGYDRLRIKYWDDFKGRAKGVVFVVDSLLLLSNIRDVADFLYTVLSDPSINKYRVPVLVACNKQDEAKAKSSKVIQNQLEKELNNIRETRISALASTDSDDPASFIIGNPNRDFQYSDLKVPIEFVDCSAKVGEQVEPIWKWLNKI